MFLDIFQDNPPRKPLNQFRQGEFFGQLLGALQTSLQLGQEMLLLFCEKNLVIGL